MQPYAKTFVLVSIGILLAYELWSVFNGRPNDTISNTIWHLSDASVWRVILPFLWGVLTMHFFMVPGQIQWLLIGFGVGAGWTLKKPGDFHL